ncbi:MAG: PAS domain S-box protein, partial [Pseudomonadota bacterium]
MNRDTKEKQDQSLRVLLVEDDPEDMTIFRRYAQCSTNYCFQVDHADMPDMMESFLSQQDYDLVFLDLRLGAAITGLELLKQIKPAWPDVPVIILTGSGDQKIAVEMMKIGATDYLTKDTFNSEILDRAVRYALEQRRSNLRRKQAEQSLKASQQRLAQIINFLPDATFVIDNEGKVIAWNRAIEKMTGIKAQEMLGKGNYEYAIPFYGERRPVLIDIVGKWDKEIEEKYQYVKKEGESLVSETYDPLVHPEGFLWNKASLLYDHNGEVIGAIESIRDISERKKSEEALRESEKKYRTVLDSNPDPVVAYDMEGKVIYLNRAFARVFGWSLDEQIGKKIDNFVPEENWPETRMMINKVTVLGEGFSGLETRRYTKEGKILDIGISGSCYRDQEGNVAASVINLRDITE